MPSSLLSATGLRSLSDAHFDQLNPPHRRLMWHWFSGRLKHSRLHAAAKNATTALFMRTMKDILP